MGDLHLFEIIFDDNKNSVFYAGDSVRGKCVIDVRDKVKNVKHLSVSIHGLAKVQWEEQESDSNGDSKTVSYDAETKIFPTQQMLFEIRNSEDKNILSQGRHEFLFTFQLPAEGLSTSFEGEHGTVRYWIKAEIVKSWSFNTTTKKAFTVICPIDINNNNYLYPIDNRVEKQLCCFCCASGPVSLYAKCDRRGYCPGESIIISAEFENLSRRQVVPRATLHQIQTFYAEGYTKTHLNNYATIRSTQLQPGESSTWNDVIMAIPAVAPSVLDCQILKVEYAVQISLEIPGAINLDLNLPIIMGTVPLRQAATAPKLDFDNPPMAPLTATPNDGNPHSPPPAYAECVGGPFDIADADDTNASGGIKFTPMYAYAPNFTPPADAQELKFPPFSED